MIRSWCKKLAFSEACLSWKKLAFSEAFSEAPLFRGLSLVERLERYRTSLKVEVEFYFGKFPLGNSL